VVGRLPADFSGEGVFPERLRGEAFIRAAGEVDMVLSSYPIVRRDAEMVRAVTWLGVILDEAQNIKNPAAKQTQAVRSLSADFRLALTGTPVETMPTLRSQMVFKEPGLIRTTTPDGYINVIDWTQNKGISILPTKKEYIEFEASNLEHEADKDSFVVVEKLRALPYEADEVLGEKEIDGRVLQGFRVIKADMITTVWIDPESTELVRVEIEYANSPGMNTIMTDFQFNAELDDSLFSLVPPEDYTRVQVQADVSTVKEEDLIDYLLMWSTWTKDGTFPPTFNPIELPKITAEMITQGKFGNDESSDQDKQAEATKMYRGIMFVTQLPAESNWRYAGENVSFGDPATPIFWYKPIGFETYRVIYADLSVKDMMPDMLPQ